ncbi:PREDICTED: defensin-like protein 43 [Camelina sativa]|uniref:Defensin-like protein 43 n=1 Tax=Camelina sativa TaxID=90675 RepID=A0ABM1R0V6_CAMSA|nr:PREDICTED: defensin-like protein 43 [Camelina sativa]XP_019092643.1 PREDICTED: defensin-like protein 43 [Camelina sativa]XP_019092644.1 PREDICTED: defensin-like protein 43 [Camelina sativa]
MGVTKTFVTFLLLITLTTSMSNYNILASKIKPTGRIRDQCKNICSTTYGNGKCDADCRKVGFSSGRCVTSSRFRNKCCCNK